MVSQQTQQSSYSSYMVSGSTDSAIADLRKDLEQTSLASIQTYPNDANTSEKPGACFVSALSDSMLDDNAYSSPRWHKHAYYTLTGNRGEVSGTLIRWDKVIDDASIDLMPQIPPVLPSTMGAKGSGFLNHCLLPGANVKMLGSLGNYTADKFGGFRLQFLTYDGTNWGLTSTNPTQSSGAAKDASKNTKLVEVELKVLQTGSIDKADYYAIKFHVRPRY
jgi:hypothetical protein